MKSCAADKRAGETLLRSLFSAADKNKQVRLSAIKEILDRRLGKANQPFELIEEIITIIPAPKLENMPGDEDTE